MMRLMIFSVAVTLLAPSALAEDARRPRVSLILSKVTAERHDNGDLWFHCDVVLDNETGDLLPVKSNFGSAFDGLEVVVTNAEGKVLIQQPYTYHQSPYSAKAGRTFQLRRGRTKTTLLFPISKFGESDQPIKVRIVGTLPESPFHGILSTDTLKVAVKR